MSINSTPLPWLRSPAMKRTRALAFGAILVASAGSIVACAEGGDEPLSPRTPQEDRAGQLDGVNRDASKAAHDRLTLRERRAVSALVKVRVERYDARGKVVEHHEQAPVRVEGEVRGGMVHARSRAADRYAATLRQHGGSTPKTALLGEEFLAALPLAARSSVNPERLLDVQATDDGHLVTIAAEPTQGGGPYGEVRMLRDNVPVVTAKHSWRKVRAGWVADSVEITIHHNGNAAARIVMTVTGDADERVALADIGGSDRGTGSGLGPSRSGVSSRVLQGMADLLLPRTAGAQPTIPLALGATTEMRAAPIGCILRVMALLAEAAAVGVGCATTMGLGCLAGIGVLATTYNDWHENCAPTHPPQQQ